MNHTDHYSLHWACLHHRFTGQHNHDVAIAKLASRCHHGVEFQIVSKPRDTFGSKSSAKAEPLHHTMSHYLTSSVHVFPSKGIIYNWSLTNSMPHVIRK